MDLHIRVPARQLRKWIASPARTLCSRRGRHAPGHWAPGVPWWCSSAPSGETTSASWNAGTLDWWYWWQWRLWRLLLLWSQWSITSRRIEKHNLDYKYKLYTILKNDALPHFSGSVGALCPYVWTIAMWVCQIALLLLLLLLWWWWWWLFLSRSKGKSKVLRSESMSTYHGFSRSTHMTFRNPQTRCRTVSMGKIATMLVELLFFMNRIFSASSCLGFHKAKAMDEESHTDYENNMSSICQDGNLQGTALQHLAPKLRTRCISWVDLFSRSKVKKCQKRPHEEIYWNFMRIILETHIIAWGICRSTPNSKHAVAESCRSNNCVITQETPNSVGGRKSMYQRQQ